jgi:hypothetical protein
MTFLAFQLMGFKGDFMLKIIEPSSHEKYQSEIDALISIFKHTLPKDFKFSLEEQAKSTYILAKDAHYGTYGGAILCKKPFCAFDDQIGRVLTLLHSHRRKTWSVQFCTYLPDCDRLSRQDRVNLFREFYVKLYKKLMVFGKHHKTSFLVVSLSHVDYVTTNLIRDWPYILEVLPDGDYFPFFHGILDIRPGNHEEILSIKYRPNQKVKQRLNAEIQIKKDDNFPSLATHGVLASFPQKSFFVEAPQNNFDSIDANQTDRSVQ